MHRTIIVRFVLRCNVVSEFESLTVFRNFQYQPCTIIVLIKVALVLSNRCGFWCLKYVLNTLCNHIPRHYPRSTKRKSDFIWSRAATTAPFLIWVLACMVGSPRSLINSSSQRVEVPEIDLTGSSAPEPTLPTAQFNQDAPFSPSPFATMPRPSPRNFNAAMRRVYTRRERLFDRATPDVMRERLDVAEECSAPSPHPAREAALTHLSRAYAVAGYAQAVLCVVVSAVIVTFLSSFARGLLSDVSRKTRERASGAIRSAALCRLNYAENGCASATNTLTPALKSLCEDWKSCMARESSAKADAVSATVWAEAVAETFNAFAERISSTSVAIGLTVVVILMFFMSSAAFGFMHKRLVDERLNSPAPPPAPQSLAGLTDKPYQSPYSKNSLRPRAISFDPNDQSPSPITTVAKRN